MKDMSYNAVMGRRAEIIKSAVGMDYSRFESGSIALSLIHISEPTRP